MYYTMRYVAGGLNSKSQTHNNDFIDILNTYSMIISSVFYLCFVKIINTFVIYNIICLRVRNFIYCLEIYIR